MIDGLGAYTVAMGAGKGYDIFPRTFKARLLLAMAFVGGLGLMAGVVVLPVLVIQLIGVFEVPPCSGSERTGCLEAQVELAAVAQPSCEGGERRVCFVPLGRVDPDLMLKLVNYYSDEHGLQIGVLSPRSIPADMINPDRDQLDGESLADSIRSLFPVDFDDPNVVLIGITPLDLYATDRDWNFQLGHAQWGARSRAVVSTYRMHLGTFRLVDDERVFTRTRKLVTKYLGLMFYGFALSDDPTSPMYGNILRVSDLDTMKEPRP